MLKYEVLPVTPFMQNCSLVWCEETRDAALIDPGGEMAHLLKAVADRGLQLKAVWLTHGHLDHVGAADEIRQQTGCPIIGPQRADAFWLEGLPAQSSMFGFPLTESFAPDRWLESGDILELGTEQVSVLHCPGHTPGHVVFWYAAGKLVWVGDVLFQGSIGRTDFPQGNHAALLDSINHRLLPLGDDVTMVPGHGPTSTLGRERMSNPFLTQPIW